MEITRTVDVDAPTSFLYKLWLDFEDYPLFMSQLEEVTPDGPGMAHWCLGTQEDPTEFDMALEAYPYEKVAWSSVTEAPFTVDVTFTPLSSERTRVG